MKGIIISPTKFPDASVFIFQLLQIQYTINFFSFITLLHFIFIIHRIFSIFYFYFLVFCYTFTLVPHLYNYTDLKLIQISTRILKSDY